jgi:hypothetical protein
MIAAAGTDISHWCVYVFRGGAVGYPTPAVSPRQTQRASGSQTGKGQDRIGGGGAHNQAGAPAKHVRMPPTAAAQSGPRLADCAPLPAGARRFDPATGDVRTYVHPDTQLRVPYCPQVRAAGCTRAIAWGAHPPGAAAQPGPPRPAGATPRTARAPAPPPARAPRASLFTSPRCGPAPTWTAAGSRRGGGTPSCGWAGGCGAHGGRRSRKQTRLHAHALARRAKTHARCPGAVSRALGALSPPPPAYQACRLLCASPTPSLPSPPPPAAQVGALSGATRAVRVRNVLTGQEDALEVPGEEVVAEVQRRYLAANAHAGSYAWKALVGRPSLFWGPRRGLGAAGLPAGLGSWRRVCRGGGRLLRGVPWADRPGACA